MKYQVKDGIAVNLDTNEQYACDAQDGVYDADKMELVWQYLHSFGEWYNTPSIRYDEFETFDMYKEDSKKGYGIETRQFLQLKPQPVDYNTIPKMETTELPSPEAYNDLKRQLNTQAKHKDSIRDYWLSCSESKKKWVEAIKEYFDSEHTEAIQSFDDFKEQFDLD